LTLSGGKRFPCAFANPAVNRRGTPTLLPPSGCDPKRGLRKKVGEKKVNLLVQFEVEGSDYLGCGDGYALGVLKLRNLHVVGLLPLLVLEVP